MIGRFADNLLKKPWSDEEVDRYVGEYRHCYLTHSRDSSVRSKAASGGAVSTLLISGLKKGEFDGAVVCTTKIERGKVRPHFYIATNADEVLQARGSKYVETRFMQNVLPLIRQFDGMVAVVGLPCDLTALKRRCEKEESLKNKVVLTVGLVCGHNSRKELIDHTTEKLEKEAGSELVDYRFRVGHWRGRLEADFADGKTLSKPTKYFNDYQNLFFFSERKCMACADHYAYDADLVVGDIWLFRLKDDPIKHSALIVRSQGADNLVASSGEHGDIEVRNLDVRDIMDGQSRIGPSHYNVSARVKAGRLLGIKLKDSVNERISWHAWLNAMITLGNMRLSETRLGKKIIFLVPRPVWKIYLYFKKALESLR